MAAASSTPQSRGLLSELGVLANLLLLLSATSTSVLVYVLGRMILGATYSTVTPTRWLVVTFLPLLIAIYGLLRQSLNRSGALFAVLVGVVLSLAHLSFLLSLLFFFFSSSRVTKYKSDLKKRIEGDQFRVGGQRNWIQVLCNGGMATEVALAYLLEVGSADLPVDFARYYNASWLGLAVLGALACCNGDTWASEIGSVWSHSPPRLITTGQKVPRGTNGAVSPMGLLVSVAGGLFVGLGYWLGIVLGADPVILQSTPSQWPVILYGGLAGLLGSLIDSILGATVQFSGQHKRTGAIVEEPGPDVEPISGYALMSNHGVNLLSSVLTGMILPKIVLNLFL